VTGRRDFLFSASPPFSGSIPLPGTQPYPLTQPLVIEQIDYNPTTGSQAQEYFVIRNPNNIAVDISGWKLSGDISLTFRGGTVIPAQGASVTAGAPNAAYINQLYVANKPAGFRARATSPKGNEHRFVVGPYDRQLSARGGSIVLSKPNNPLDPAAGYTTVLTQNFTGNPTAHQNYLRVGEINFRPAPATAAELAVLAGLVPSDFEFIELVNTGPAALNLGKAYFEEGIAFTFPINYMLNPGQRCLIVASQSAFEARYGTGLPIAGEFEGNLDNAGERIRLVDPVGEEVLDFTYDDDWFPVPEGQYRSFVTRTTAPGYSTYGTATTWALSGAQNGSPAAGDTSFSTVYEGWRLDYFSAAELPTVENPNAPAALTQDVDGDGLNNFSEYVFGHAPKTADSSVPLATATKVNVSGGEYLAVTFTRPKDALDVNYFVEASVDLSNPAGWSNVGILIDSVDVGNGLQQVTYRDNTPIALGGRCLRVRAVKP
jgi:hypothetical protein